MPTSGDAGIAVDNPATRELYEPFLQRFAHAVRELRVGPANDPRSQIGR